MLEFKLTGEALWARMNRAVEKIQQRLERAAHALEMADIPYAIIGGNAVRAWVAQIDEAAVRTTRDVDILVRRSDMPAAIVALERAGFVYRHTASVDMFLDGPKAKARDAVRVLMAGEKVHESDLVTTPSVDDSVIVASHRIVSLEALVEMKLNIFRDKDKVHLRDMIDVGLIDKTWVARYPADLGRRLQQLLDNPEG